MAVVCVVFISFGFPAFTAYINQIFGEIKTYKTVAEFMIGYGVRCLPEMSQVFLE
jgi:hypothetical protein